MEASNMTDVNSQHYEVFRIEMSTMAGTNRPFELLLNNLMSWKTLVHELYDKRPFEISIYRYEADDGYKPKEKDNLTYLLKTKNYKYIKNYLSEFGIKNDDPEMLNKAKFILAI